MDSPKLLPWYARKFGVSIDRANQLWRESVRDATENAGRAGKTEYSGDAMNGLINLLEHERDAFRYPPEMCSLAIRQRRLWKLPMIVIRDCFNGASGHWQRQRIDLFRQRNIALRRSAYRTTPACNSR